MGPLNFRGPFDDVLAACSGRKVDDAPVETPVDGMLYRHYITLYLSDCRSLTKQAREFVFLCKELL